MLMCVDCVGPTIILGGYQNTTGSANGFETRFCEGFFIWNISEMFGSADSAHFVVVEDGKAGKKIPV